jgi:hypothetical protein
MFQGLTQGAIIPILYKNEPRVADGKVMAVNTHMPTYNPSQPMALLNGPVTDITVQVGNDTIPFAGLPANGVVANFPDKGLFISTDRAAILREIESMASASKQVLEQVPAHQKMVKDCETLLIQLQPEKQKEAQQAQEIESLKTQLSEMNGKFDKLVELLSAKSAE